MGMDCYAHTYIGIKIDTDKLFSKKKVKAYKHSYGEDFDFDPKTGKCLWKETIVPNKEIFPDADDEDEDFYFPDQSIEGYDICSLSTSGDDEGEYVVAMRDLSTGSHRSYDSDAVNFFSLDPDTFKSEYDKFKATMQKYGLWTDTFGVYNLLYISV